MYTALHLDKIFSKDKDVEITVINRDNFFLFTPMRCEVVSSSIETRHMTNPIRAFFNKVSFQRAEVHSMDLKKHIVATSHSPQCEIYNLENGYLWSGP